MPQISDIEFLDDYLRPKFGAKIAILHGELGKSQCYANWVKIRQNKAKIVLGTRSSILAPMKNPGLIIIDGEEASDHKQSDQNPRYDVRKIAKNLGIKIIFSSSAPRVEAYYQATNKKIKLLSPPRYVTATVNMKDELLIKNYSPISSSLENSISLALKKEQKVLLFLNRKGTATMVVCKDCNYLFKCSYCDLPLPYHETEKQLICHHCERKQPAPLTCPACRGTNLKYIGTGTQKVEAEVRKLFPNKKIIRLDKDTIYYRLNINDYEIIIATQLIFRLFPIIENCGLVGVVSSDSLLYRPSFRSDEKTFELITKILVWSDFNKVTRVLFQGYVREHYSLDSAIKQNYERFYAQEIKNRAQLYYPPFVKLIKLIYKHEDQKKALYQAQKLTQQLQKFRNIQVIGHLTPYIPKLRGCFYQEIILKTPPGFKLDSNLIPPNWLVDVEPEEIL